MITTSEDILKDVSNGLSPLNTKIFLGCAVWDQGQLDNEILENSWIITNSNKNLIFYNDTELSLWNMSLKEIGIDSFKLAPYSGNA